MKIENFHENKKILLENFFGVDSYDIERVREVLDEFDDDELVQFIVEWGGSDDPVDVINTMKVYEEVCHRKRWSI